MRQVWDRHLLESVKSGAGTSSALLRLGLRLGTGTFWRFLADSDGLRLGTGTFWRTPTKSVESSLGQTLLLLGTDTFLGCFFGWRQVWDQIIMEQGY
jgi:hypothetical protein